MSDAANEILIETVVAGVLRRLASLRPEPKPVLPLNVNPSPDHLDTPAETRPPVTVIEIREPVITSGLLEERKIGIGPVRFPLGSVLTPTARDYLKAHSTHWTHTAASGREESAASRWAAVVVQSTPASLKALNGLSPKPRVELLGCPDEAAKFAVGEISRGGFDHAVILTEQIHRVACLSNRSDRIKAVALRDHADIGGVQKELRANVWCIDPRSRSDFEIRRLLRSLIVN